VLDEDYQPTSPGVATSAAPRPGTTAYANAFGKRKIFVFDEENIGHMTFGAEANMVALSHLFDNRT
jgi:hypothetical protein